MATWLENRRTLILPSPSFESVDSPLNLPRVSPSIVTKHVNGICGLLAATWCRGRAAAGRPGQATLQPPAAGRQARRSASLDRGDEALELLRRCKPELALEQLAEREVARERLAPVPLGQVHADECAVRAFTQRLDGDRCERGLDRLAEALEIGEPFGEPLERMGPQLAEALAL